VAWRGVAEESEDPWLCGPGFCRVCLCRDYDLVRLSLRVGTTAVKKAKMTWKPSEDVDRAVRGWMKAKGWEVVEWQTQRQRDS
jgi:hypothetical protein